MQGFEEGGGEGLDETADNFKVTFQKTWGMSLSSNALPKRKMENKEKGRGSSLDRTEYTNMNK